MLRSNCDDLGHERVLHIHDDVIHHRHLAVEVHSSAYCRHLAVAAHELALSDEDRRSLSSEVLCLDMIFILLRKYGLEHH